MRNERDRSTSRSSPDRLSTWFWRSTLRWVLLGLVLLGLVDVGAYVFGLFGSLGVTEATARALAGLPEQVALLLALAGFGGGFSVGKARPQPEGSPRAALIVAALVTYALAALIHPLASYALLSNETLGAAPARYPMGAELPWTLWQLRVLAVEEGLGGGGPITPLVRSHLYGFSLYFPFLVTALGASTAWAGLVVGDRVAGLTRPVISRSIAWAVWFAQACGFYLGTKIALALILHAGWTAEHAALLPAGVTIMVPALLALIHSVDSGGLERTVPSGSAWS